MIIRGVFEDQWLKEWTHLGFSESCRVEGWGEGRAELVTKRGGEWSMEERLVPELRRLWSSGALLQPWMFPVPRCFSSFCLACFYKWSNQVLEKLFVQSHVTIEWGWKTRAESSSFSHGLSTVSCSLWHVLACISLGSLSLGVRVASYLIKSSTCMTLSW